MAGQTVDFNAIAKQFGGVSAPPANAPSGPIDYAALAKQHGAVSSGAGAAPSLTDHLKNEGFLDSAWGALKGTIGTIKDVFTGEYSHQTNEMIRRYHELEKNGTPEERRQFAKEGILQSVPFASTAYKILHGNLSGAAGDVVGMAALPIAAEGVPRVAGAVSDAARVATNPEVLKAGAQVLPKGPAMVKLYDAVQKARGKGAATAAEPPAPASPGEALAKSQGLDYAKLSADERALLDHVAKAQANTAQPPIPDPVVRESRTTEMPAQTAGPIPNETNAVAQETPTQTAGPGKSIAQMIQEEVAARKAAAGEPPVAAEPAPAPVAPKPPRPARTGAAYRPGVSYTTSPGGPAGTMPQITADMTRAQMEAAGVPANATAGDIAQAVHASPASPAAPPPVEAPAVAAPAPLPPQEAAAGAPQPPSLAQQEAWMAAKGAPPTEAPQSRVTATGEAKSPQLRAAEITGANRTAKAQRFAETLYGNGDGLSSKDLSEISAGRTSQMQRDAGKPHGWGDIADSIGEKDPSGDTVAEIIHQVREMEKKATATVAKSAPVQPPAKKPDQMNRAELAKQAGLPADATPQQIMEAMAREMGKK